MRDGGILILIKPTQASPTAPLQGERGVICCVTTKLPVFISIGMPIQPYIIISAITKLPAPTSIYLSIPGHIIISATTRLPMPISICLSIQPYIIISAITKRHIPISRHPHGILLPSPLGEGLGVRPFFRKNNTLCAFCHFNFSSDLCT